ncbi:hypothetical protein AMS68_004184 [Peltaster fructicola]|uniref:Mei2-like C-terminal RNA recognition motif domain-containing protein n=1 Tax=Peltaster fructicola TaxID=286661 RepID=A0A6H0XV83_9PEZI|nr:hypothetical protein AMS68_004184 [Peltaster fructicola]
MDSRQNSIGGVSPTGFPDDNTNRSRVSTPSLASTSGWGNSARGDSFASSSSHGILRAGASAFMPRNAASPSGSRLRFLSMTSTDDTDDSPIIVTSAPKAKNAILPIGTKSSSKSTSPVHARAWFTTDIDPNKPPMGGHFMLVQGVKDVDLKTGIIALIEKDFSEEIAGKKLIKEAPDAMHTDVVLFINDVRVASTIYYHLECEGLLTVSFVNYDWYTSAKGVRIHGPEVTTMYVAQVTFVAEFKGRTTDFDPTINVYDKVHEVAASYGLVLALEQNKSAQYPLAQFRVEYFKVSSALRAMEVAKCGIKFDDMPGWIIFAKQYVVPTGSPAVYSKKLHQKPEPLVITALKAADVPSNGAEIVMSPTGRTAWYTDSDGVDHPVPPPRPVATVNRENDPPSGWTGKEVVRHDHFTATAAPPAARRPLLEFRSHGNVDTSTYVPQGNEVALYRGRNEDLLDMKPSSDIIPQRIFEGLDVRTTVMMRNIPVTWGWKQLKAALDLVCAGRFNFMYLRMDFKRAENVGYAFVNFESAEDIVTFLSCWLGKRWDPADYRYPKLVQCSYATIQGLDQLIEKFRNSSVMDEHADYRPMLFQTAPEKAKEEAEVAHMKSRGLPAGRICEVGEKKVFPAWNNRAKKERSTANAGHIGLFAPKFQRFNGDRRYRSYYDRGNPAELVESQPWAPPPTPYGGPAMAYGAPATPLASPVNGAFASQFPGPSTTSFGVPQPTAFTSAPHQVMVPPHVASYNFGAPRYQAVYPPNMGGPMQPAPYGFVAVPFAPGYAPQMPANRDSRAFNNGAGDSKDADAKMADGDRH